MAYHKRVVVAMSGGVDSSVAAAVLKAQGYEVTGIMLRLWSETGKETYNRCCTPDSMALARRVAGILEIPFYVIDAQTLFRETVVQYFLDGYTKGLTPNPCLECNRKIRWTYLLQRALALGANYLATGHYARVERDLKGTYLLRRAVDKNKDQSYVLHVLNQQQLGMALFPLGGYTKSTVRRLADQFNLPVTHRSESQDLCFLAGGDYRNFLQRHSPTVEQQGPIFDTAGKQLGTHRGFAYYTIGQRKGLGINSQRPLYVIDKNPATNAIYVGPREALGKSTVIAANANWISGAPPPNGIRVEVKIRYTAKPLEGLLSLDDQDRIIIELNSLATDITPGQAAVIYSGDKVLGGGLIQPGFS